MSPCPQIACSVCVTVPTDCLFTSQCVSPCPQIACLVCVTVPTDCLFSVCHRAHRLPVQCVSPCPQIACSRVSVCHREHRLPVHSVSVSPCPQIACSFNQCVTVPTDRLFIQSVCVTVPTDCLFIQSVYHRARRLPVHTVSAYHRAHRLPVHSISVSPCPQIVYSFNQCVTVPTDCLFIQSAYHRARRLPVHTVSAYHRAHRRLEWPQWPRAGQCGKQLVELGRWRLWQGRSCTAVTFTEVALGLETNLSTVKPFFTFLNLSRGLASSNWHL